MKILKYFLSVCFCVVPSVLFGAGPVATTAGGNLTAYNPNGGLQNNNNWAIQTNGRYNQKGADVKADFGNCNSLIIRCAQPKCSGGGCVNIDVARPIVSGCVKSNSSCKQYGDDLIEYISAQMVADAQAEIQQQELAMQQAAAEAAAAASAAQGNEQLQAMQAQMQQMQYEMQQQNSETIAQLQNALEEQKQMTADAIAKSQEQSSVPQSVVDRAEMNDLTVAQQIAVDNQVPPEVLERQKIAGQIMTNIENVEKTLLGLKEVMKETFEYAGCDSRGNNCRGPKRVEKFKSIANGFFDPYNNVLDEMYEALITAQMVGIDINDIYMMLDGSCNRWGKYYCTHNNVQPYDKDNCLSGKSQNKGNGTDQVKGGAKCTIGMAIPPSDRIDCTFTGYLENMAEVEDVWLSPLTLTDESGKPKEGNGEVRVGCASAILDNTIFGRRQRSKTQSAVDIDILQRILDQDAPTSVKGLMNKVNYCAIDEGGYVELQKAATSKNLPKSKVCVKESLIKNNNFLPLHNVEYNVDVELSEDACVACSSNSSKGEKCTNDLLKNRVEWKGGKCQCIKNFVVKNGICIAAKHFVGTVLGNDSQQSCKGVGGIWTPDDMDKCFCPTDCEYTEKYCMMKGSIDTKCNGDKVDAK